MKLYYSSFVAIYLLFLVSCSQSSVSINSLETRFIINNSENNLLVEVYNKEKNSLFTVQNILTKKEVRFTAGYFNNSYAHKPFSVKNGLLLFSTKGPGLESYSTETGYKQWQYDYKVGSNYFLPNNFLIYDKSIVYISSVDNQYRLSVLDIESGEIIYEVFIDSIDFNPLIYPIKVGSKLIYGNTSFYALDLKSLTSQLISGDLANSLGNRGKIISVLDNEFITFSERNGELIKYRLTEANEFKKVICKKLTDEMLKYVTSVEIVGNECIFWGERNVWCYNLSSDQLVELKLDSEYTKVWEFDDAIFNKYDSIYISDLAFFAKNDSLDLKLYNLSLTAKEVREINLPAVIPTSNIAYVNSFYHEGSYYFDLTTTENNNGQQHDFLLTYDAISGQITSLIEFYNKSRKRHNDWQIGNHIVYGLYEHEDSVFYYDFDVKNATMLRTNIPEEDYRIIKL